MPITQKINVLYLTVMAVLATHTLFAGSERSYTETGTTPIGYYTTGVDCYKNGAPLAEGEFYALIWEQEPGAFTGFRRDGSLCNPAGSEVVSLIRADLVKSNCGHVTFYIPTNLHPDGSYGVVVLDTRGVDGVPVGIRPGARMPRLVNGWGWANMKKAASSEGVYAKKLVATANSVTGENSGHVTDKDTDLPSDCPNPVISAMSEDEKGKLVLRVAQTRGYGAYAAITGDELSKINLRSGVANGSEDSCDIEIHTDRKVLGRGFARVVIINPADDLGK